MKLQFNGVAPSINENAYVSESVDIIGDVKVEENVSIWFGARLRADMNKIVIGANSNIQENAVVHVDIESPVIIGENVTIGHSAIIHGCNISNNVLVGMGSIILNNAKISKNSIVGAGALVTQGKEFEEGVLILGNPAKAVRKLSEEEIEEVLKISRNYFENKAYSVYFTNAEFEYKNAKRKVETNEYMIAFKEWGGM